MVREKLKKRDEIYRRFDEKGRMLPGGLKYVSSWIDKDLTQCFQRMETDDAALFETSTSRRDDLADFEIIPAVTSEQAKEMSFKQD